MRKTEENKKKRKKFGEKLRKFEGLNMDGCGSYRERMKEFIGRRMKGRRK